MSVTREQLKDIMEAVAPGLPYVVKNTGDDFMSMLMGAPLSSPNMSTAWHREDCSFHQFEIDPTLLHVAPNVESVAMIASHEYGHYVRKSCGKNNVHEESQADLFGYAHMLKVGYDPRKAVDMWQASSRWADERGLSNAKGTHPEDNERVKDMLEWIERNRTEIESRFGKGVR